MSGTDKVWPLQGNQMRAVVPDESVWLSASAGTGKTQVLSSRVLRLLLQPDVDPSQILCLTFTKAGATEMAGRINDTLARWVRQDKNDLFHELEAIGAPSGPEARAHARTLFARVLDCPGGGLRIDTIHAFAQWLLGAFPQEIGLIPGSRAMEDRERVLLQRQVLADLLVEAESEPLGDPQLLEALADLSLRLGPDQVEAWLMRCAGAIDAWTGPGGWQEPMRPRINQLLGLKADADETMLADLCADERFDTISLRHCMTINAAWKAKTGQDNASVIGDWLSCSPLVRSRGLEELYEVFHTKKGDPRSSSSQEKIDPAYPRYAAQVSECIARVRETKALLGLADRLVPAFRLGRKFALAWDKAKLREGLIDFDDQIRMAARLLSKSEMAEWIRYKMDRRFDHILVDEAQDTNAAQWGIVDALTEEFWAGLGQRDERMRTLFVVGDYKQAIFRFQGTSPENFRQAADRVRGNMQGAVDNAAMLRSNVEPRPLLELGLDRSFRMAQNVLSFVDKAIGAIGHESFGLDKAPEPHVGDERPGQVVLWRPVGMASENEDEADADEGAENWLSKPERDLADLIARQVRQWLDSGYQLVKGKQRPVTAGDIMVLVRKRGELAALIVARLHAHKVAVAGVDRLRLGAPLAVKDLVAALRFAAQPFDDLNLAALLVSPLVGWTQEQLLEHGYREKHASLWAHLRRRAGEPVVAQALEQLGGLLAKADYDPPQALLHWLLTGPWQGRVKLVARLGHEANDPIDELLNAAHAYAMTATPSLVGFLAWFDAGEGELKREAEAAGGLVRVMTVHGSKGLQAPIVILADACGNPDTSKSAALDMPDPQAEHRKLPLPPLSKEERAGRIAEEHDKVRQAEREEHWRLLYVAMTRAEEALFVGGALTTRDKGVPPPDSWYARLQQVFGEQEWNKDELWRECLRWGDAPTFKPSAKTLDLDLQPALLAWLKRPPAAEPRPPRPLAPSSLGEDLSADPPYPPGGDPAAARRGVLIHKLLERLPEVPVGQRREAGLAWLARNAPEADADGLLRGAMAVLEPDAWAALFSSSALAEVPIAATVGERVIAGTIDRLLIEPDRIRLVDFKTTRRPPDGVDKVPVAILRQMAAYACALEAAYPGRAIEAALLYTEVPALLEIPADVLTQHKQALLSPE